MGNEIENGEIERCVPRMEIPRPRVDARAPLTQEQYNIISKPAHYNQGKIQPIEVIRDWNLSFELGSCIKYVARAPHKGTHLQDLEKARQYITMEIEQLTAK